MSEQPHFRTPRDLLEHVQSDRSLSPSQIEVICKQFRSETIWHDFKSGRVGGNEKPGRRVRDILASFGNSEGGVLFIGIEQLEDPKGDAYFEPDGITLRTNETVDQYVSNQLQYEWSRYSPPPKLGQCLMPDGKLIIWLSVARQPAHIFVQDQLYLRMIDGTKRAPEYLIGDLLLGKRQHPTFRVSLLNDGARAQWSDEITLRFRVDNESIVHSPEVRCGLIALSDEDGRADASLPGVAPFIAVRRDPASTYHRRHWVLTHSIEQSEDKSGLWPFSHATFSFQFKRPASRTGWVARAALYLLPRGGRPHWFQIEIVAGPHQHGLHRSEPRSVDIYPWSCTIAPSSMPIVENSLTPAAA